MWNDIKQALPPLETEVLVWVNGHRGPAWANNYALVAYRHPDGNFYQERHPYAEPIVGVLYWREIEKPNTPVTHDGAQPRSCVWRTGSTSFNHEQHRNTL